jgi:hypothetical protein
MTFWEKIKKESPTVELERVKREMENKVGQLSSKGKGGNRPKKGTEEVKKVLKEVLVEKEVIIKPDRSEFISLGQLDRGISLLVEAKEVHGENFSLYLMDLDNLKKYQRNDYTKGAMLKGNTIAMYEHQIMLTMNSKYFLVITSRAVKSDRTVSIRVVKLSS